MRSITANGIPACSAPRAVLWCLLTALFAPHADATNATAADIQTGHGWRYRVFAENLPKVDGVVVRRDGSVFATQCLGDGAGRVVRLRGGQPESIASNLERPRGLLVKKQSLYVTEQISGGRMLEISLIDGSRRTIDNLANPEHVRKLPDGDLIVTENGLNGRLVRITSKELVEVVTAGLNDPEGLAVGADGTARTLPERPSEISAAGPCASDTGSRTRKFRASSSHRRRRSAPLTAIR